MMQIISTCYSVHQVSRHWQNQCSQTVSTHQTLGSSDLQGDIQSMMQTLLLATSVSTIPVIEYQRNKVKTTLKLKQSGKTMSTWWHTITQRKWKECFFLRVNLSLSLMWSALGIQETITDFQKRQQKRTYYHCHLKNQKWKRGSREIDTLTTLFNMDKTLGYRDDFSSFPQN